MSIEEFKIKPNSLNALFGSYVASHSISNSVIFLCTGIGCKAYLTMDMQGHETGNKHVSRMGWSQFDQNDIIKGHTQKIERGISYQLQRFPSGFFPLVISPLIKVVGMDEQIKNTANYLRKKWKKNISYVKLSGVEGEFWEGYNELILSFISNMKWQNTFIEKGTVNIFGYPFDRYENEHKSNIKILTNYLRKLGIKTQAVFLSGTSTAELAKARHAQFNIVLPFASKIGPKIEKITKKKTLYLDNPLGLEPTTKWLKRIGKIFKAENKATSIIELQKKQRQERLARLKKKFQSKKAGLILDLPNIIGMYSLLTEIGFSVDLICIRDNYFGGKELLCKLMRYYGHNPNNVNIIQNYTSVKLNEATHKDIDLIVCSSMDKVFIQNKSPKFLIYGFPSYEVHYLNEEKPLWGFEGYDNLCETIENLMEDK
ncbi:MAG: nitrogenase component 1 [bacterium]